jgi:hypothetical protein
MGSKYQQDRLPVYLITKLMARIVVCMLITDLQKARTSDCQLYERMTLPVSQIVVVSCNFLKIRMEARASALADQGRKILRHFYPKGIHRPRYGKNAASFDGFYGDAQAVIR